MFLLVMALSSITPVHAENRNCSKLVKSQKALSPERALIQEEFEKFQKLLDQMESLVSEYPSILKERSENHFTYYSPGGVEVELRYEVSNPGTDQEWGEFKSMVRLQPRFGKFDRYPSGTHLHRYRAKSGLKAGETSLTFKGQLNAIARDLYEELKLQYPLGSLGTSAAFRMELRSLSFHGNYQNISNASFELARQILSRFEPEYQIRVKDAVIEPEDKHTYDHYSGSELDRGKKWDQATRFQK